MMALEGIRVLDLSRLLPGPYATMYLADFGAEVIKIEQPGEGDYSRAYWPQLNGMGYRFLIVNRNKKSMTLDLKSVKGKEIFLKLAAEADVLVESFRPGVMKRLGLDYEALRNINPRLVYCALSGFGQQGPYAMEAGHDLNYISAAGITHLTGAADGPPIIPGIQVADLTGGLLAVIGILIALQARDQSGEGQYVDTSLFAGAVATLPAEASVYFGSGQAPARGSGRLTGGWPHYSVYRTKDDRYLACSALEPKFWGNLCRLLNREDLISQVEDQANFPAIRAALTAAFAEKTYAEWLELLEGKDTCVAGVKTLDETFDDPHLLANQLAVELEDEKFGSYWQLGIPIKLSATPGGLRAPAPDLGEHNAELLAELGYSEGQIQALRAANII